MKLNMRGINLVLAAILILAFSGAALAGQVFTDVEEGRWSEQVIAEMKAKGIVSGIGGGKYGPDQPVTREQLMVMLVKTLGMADQAGGDIPVTFTYRDEVSSWARGSVALAIREGIIKDSDLRDRPGEPARRYEVAVFVIRAMGLEDKAEQMAGANIPFSDASEIPQWARGYVALISEEKIMGGKSDGTFDPMGELTREQVAAVLSRIDDKLNVKRDNVLRGVLYGVGAIDKKITITDAYGSRQDIYLADDALIYKEGSKINYLNLESDDKLEIVLNSDGKASYIEVIPDNEFTFGLTKVEGEIEGVFLSAGTLVIKKQDGSQATYNLADNVQVILNGESSSAGSLATGQAVTVWVDGNTVTKIEAQTLNRVVNGIITSVDGEDKTLIVESFEGTASVFTVNEDTEIKISGDTAEFDELLAGQKVLVVARNNLALEIYADDYRWSLTGTFVLVDFAGGTITVINEETGGEETYKLASRVDVKKDGDDLSLRDLLAGDEVRLELINKTVESIEASTVESEDEGELLEVVVSSTNPRITIETAGGEQIEYKIASNVQIRRDRVRASLYDLKPGDLVGLEIEGQHVVRIDAESPVISKFKIGRVEKVYDDDLVLVIENNETGENEQIYLPKDENDVDIIRYGKFIDLNDIDEGDIVVIVGDPKKEYFIPVTIVVVGTN